MLKETMLQIPSCVRPSPGFYAAAISNTLPLLAGIIELVVEYSLGPELLRMATGKLKAA